MIVRPLIFITIRNMSGGSKRVFEVLKRAKSHGIDYVVAFDRNTYDLAVKIFPTLTEVLNKYTLYMINFPSHCDLKVPGSFAVNQRHTLKFAVQMSKIARNESVDFILSPYEDYSIFLESYFTGTVAHKPWTAIYQTTPVIGLCGFVEGSNSPWHRANEILGDKPLHQRIGLLLGLFHQLKVSEKTLILSVSKSINDEVKALNPNVSLHVIEPGCGVDVEEYRKAMQGAEEYEAIFFARITPEKGLFDLPKVWKFVVEKIPKARLIVAGKAQDAKYVKIFYSLLQRYGLSKNVLYIGEQTGRSLISFIKCSKVLVFPSKAESFSLSVLESLTCGTPAVTYDIPGIRHHFHSCEAVIKVPIGDIVAMANAIIYLLENKRKRIKLSAEAKLYAEKFDWNRVIEAEKDAYLDVIDWFNA